MTETNFCPYDGKIINYNNMAYELVYPQNWNWERVKQETVIGTTPRIYIREQDDRRGGAESHKPVMLLENRQKQGKDGFTLLKESLLRAPETVASKGHSDSGPASEPGRIEKKINSYEDYIRQAYGMSSANPSAPAFGVAAAKDAQTEEFLTDGPMKLYYRELQGMHTFLDEHDDPVMYALPCCPYCHRRLPIGWQQAQDFLGISVIASPSMDTQLWKEPSYWQGLQKNCTYKGKQIHIKSAQYRMPEDESQVLQVPEPQFLHVTFGQGVGKKTMIVGLYHHTEVSELQAEPWMHAELKQILEKISADMYIFEPRVMEDPDETTGILTGQIGYVPGKVMTPYEQAEFQRKHKGEVITAADLLRMDEPKAAVEIQGRDFWPVYRGMMASRQNFDLGDQARRMRFVGVLPGDEAPADYDIDRDGLAVIRRDYGKGISWHCADGKGYATINSGHEMGGESILTGEAVETLILHRIEEHGWR